MFFKSNLLDVQIHLHITKELRQDAKVGAIMGSIDGGAKGSVRTPGACFHVLGCWDVYKAI